MPGYVFSRSSKVLLTMTPQSSWFHPQKNVGLRSSGFTIVELIVVFTIVSLLAALLLPALQNAREAARKASCKNNLRQLALALADHHDTQGRFPYGGWGRGWTGMPNRGSGRNQPGGWIYSILPQLEKASLHDLGSNKVANGLDAAYQQRHQTPLTELSCPSRRPVSTWPVVRKYGTNPLPFGATNTASRTDYAINSGASLVFVFPGPKSLDEGSDSQWWRLNGSATLNIYDTTGVSHLRQGASTRDVEDGLSNTYLAGEKYVDTKFYFTGQSPGDATSPYAGYSFDTHRFVADYTSQGKLLYYPPLRDTQHGPELHFPFARFGSAHPTSFEMAFCDASVRSVSYEISSEVHRKIGHRNDGAIVADYQ